MPRYWKQSIIHYAASTAQQRTAPSPSGTPGAFRNGATTHSSEYDFDTSVSKLNTLYQGSQYGAYTVRGGESLQSIAANLWGDAALWYKLAEVNGLTGASVLSAGQTLTIPAGVIKNTQKMEHSYRLTKASTGRPPASARKRRPG